MVATLTVRTLAIKMVEFHLDVNQCTYVVRNWHLSPHFGWAQFSFFFTPASPANRPIRNMKMKLLSMRGEILLPLSVLLLVLVVSAVNGFSVGGSGGAGLSMPSFLRRTTTAGSSTASSSAVVRMAVRLAAEAKNASEISHETLADYRQKLSVIPRANGDDTGSDEVSK